MNKEELNFIVRVLRNINYFSSCSPAEIDNLLNKFSIKKFSRGKLIIKKNSVSSHFYIIYRGKVEILSEKSLFSKEVISHLQEGDYFGEISIVLDMPTTAYVRTVKGTSVFALRREDFKEMLERNSELRDKIMDMALKRKDVTEKESQTQEIADKAPEKSKEEQSEEKFVTYRKRIIKIKYRL